VADHGGCSLLSLASFPTAGDPSLNNNLSGHHPQHLRRVAPTWLTSAIRSLDLPALLIPVACLHASWRLLNSATCNPRLVQFGAFLGLIAMLAGLSPCASGRVGLFGQTIVRGGGVIGHFWPHLKGWFNTIGAALFLTIGLIVAAILVARFSWCCSSKGCSDGSDRLTASRSAYRSPRARATDGARQGPRPGHPHSGPAPGRSVAVLQLPGARGRGKRDKEPLAQETFDFHRAVGTYRQPPLSCSITTVKSQAGRQGGPDG